jgi:RimJ/RimL family protein N-acetyltransferase
MTSSIIIRELKFTDITCLNRMYDSISNTDKLYFHPDFLGFHPQSFAWLPQQIALVLSTCKTLKKIILNILPQAYFIALIAQDSELDMIGFCFLKIKQYSLVNDFTAELGLMVVENNQKQGLGSSLISCILELAAKMKIGKIQLKVLAKNNKAIHLYRKFGFKTTRLIKNGEQWNGKMYDYVEMWLDTKTSSSSYKILAL